MRGAIFFADKKEGFPRSHECDFGAASHLAETLVRGGAAVAKCSLLAASDGCLRASRSGSSSLCSLSNPSFSAIFVPKMANEAVHLLRSLGERGRLHFLVTP